MVKEIKEKKLHAIQPIPKPKRGSSAFKELQGEGLQMAAYNMKVRKPYVSEIFHGEHESQPEDATPPSSPCSSALWKTWVPVASPSG